MQKVICFLFPRFTPSFTFPKTSLENNARFRRESAGRRSITRSHSKCFSFGKYCLGYQRQSGSHDISMPFYLVSSSHNLAIKSLRASLQMKIFVVNHWPILTRKQIFRINKPFQKREFYGTKSGKGALSEKVGLEKFREKTVTKGDCKA